MNNTASEIAEYINSNTQDELQTYVDEITNEINDLINGDVYDFYGKKQMQREFRNGQYDKAIRIISELYDVLISLDNGNKLGNKRMLKEVKKTIQSMLSITKNKKSLKSIETELIKHGELVQEKLRNMAINELLLEEVLKQKEIRTVIVAEILDEVKGSDSEYE